MTGDHSDVPANRADTRRPRVEFTVIDLTQPTSTEQATKFVVRTAATWGVAKPVVEELKAIGVDLVRAVLAYNINHPRSGEPSPVASLWLRRTSPGKAVVEIWDARIPVVPAHRSTRGQRFQQSPSRPLHRYYRIARIQIGAVGSGLPGH